MPSDLPAAPPAATIPYYRLIAFVGGGGVTFALLLVLTSLVQHAFAH